MFVPDKDVKYCSCLFFKSLRISLPNILLAYEMRFVVLANGLEDLTSWSL
jgi:hypothetical protein